MESSILNSNNNQHKIDILIIGAGLSGLTSALKIQHKDPSLQVRILEASSTVGGEISQTRLGEIGAKWITEDQYQIYRLLTNLNVSIQKRKIMDHQLKSYQEIDEGLFASLAKYELWRYIGELELKMEFFKPGLNKSQKSSMYYHICHRLFFKNSRKYMMNLVLLICGADARDVSFENFMGICYTCGGLKRLIDLLLFEAPSCSLLEFSSKDLVEQLLKHLKQMDILFLRKVREIIQYRDHVEVKDSQNEYHMADVVILAVPWNSIQEIYFWPVIPVELQRPPLPAGTSKFIITSFLASYRESHWRTKGFSGHFVRHEPILVAYEYRPTIYSGYMVHEEGLEPLIASTVLYELAKKFGKEMLVPIEFQQHSYELNNLAHLPLTTPWNRVIWSSSSAAGTCYRGCLGGAVQSGLRAAMNALLVVRPQIVTWQDLAEVQCHDYLPRREASTWISLWLSSWNVYNVTTYTLSMCGLVLILSKVYKRH